MSSRHKLRGYRALAGNRLALLVDGAEAFPAMLAAIAAAQRTVVLETYIYCDDETGRRFLVALTEAAQRGVKVRVTIDGFGSYELDSDFFRPLLDAGGKVAVFRPPRFWHLGRAWVRDHRKMVVADDVDSYVGGLNISNDYAPEDWGGQQWHDIAARVEGPASRELTKVFNRTWRVSKHVWSEPGRAGGRMRRKLMTRFGSDGSSSLGPAVVRGDVAVQVIESRLSQHFSVRRAYLHAIRKAEHSIRISNAYFIPDRGIRRGLRNAAARGVKVQLLLAGETDIRAVKLASRGLYAGLMKHGIEIYEWTDRVLHAKSASIDGEWCSIGSFNLDRRSLFHNLEANIACVDRALGAQLDAQFERDIARSNRIDPATWHRRSGVEKLLERLFLSLRFLL